MTTAELERIKSDIESARNRGDLAAVARLRFGIPLEARNEWDKSRGHEYAIAKDRGQRAPRPQLIEGPAPRPRSTAAPQGWPSAISMHPSLERELKNVEFDGHEQAGWLVGPSGSESGDLEIFSLFAGADDDTSTWRSVALDIDRALTVWNQLPTSQTICGEYHVHPPDTTANASAQDLKAAASLARSFGKSHWISIVICEKREGRYAHVDLGAYAVRPDGNYSSLPITTARSY